MIVRKLDYYDLIELPNKRHVPVPIAIKVIGVKNVLKIPISDEVRDDHFYWCDKCAELFPLYEGSFFKCWWHNMETVEENEKKISLLKSLVEKGEFNKLKYIVAASTGGYVLVTKDGKIVGRSLWYPDPDKWEIVKEVNFNPKFVKLRPKDKRGIWFEPISDYYRRIIIMGLIAFMIVATATYLLLSL